MKRHFQKGMEHRKLAAMAVMSAVGLSACGGDGEGFDIEEVAPIVNSAAPAALKVSASASIWKRSSDVFASLSQLLLPTPAVAQTVTTPAQSIQAMFTGTFGKISGGDGTGYINSLLEDMDSRMTEVETRFAEGAPDCLSNTAQDHEFDLGVHADAKVTLPIQCIDEFAQGEGEQSRPGSGMVFGQSDTAAGVVLLLKHRTSTASGGSDSMDAGFGYAASISGKGTTDEAVQMVFGQFNSSGSFNADPYDAPTIARVYAKPSTNTYELALAGYNPSTGKPMSGGDSNVGCGLHLKSDGTYIYAKGYKQASGSQCLGSGSSAGSDFVGSFEICLNAADMSDATAGSCNTLRDATSNLGTLTAFDYTAVSDSGDSATIFSGLNIGSEAIAAKATATSGSSEAQ